ncbi:MAG: ABC transporter permease subunit [Proteobacteria bacterium]|nr:ABC transporter permease subunit [Pseudomonadota bacterium]
MAGQPCCGAMAVPPGACSCTGSCGGAVGAPLFYPHDAWQMVTRPFLPPFEEAIVPFGTDMLGRDIAAGIAHGARVSLLVGLISTIVACLVGIGFGAFAGYYGGFFDDALMRITEFFMTIPTFVFAIVLVAIFTPSIYSIVAAIAIVSWPPVARLVRGEFLSLRERGERPCAYVRDVLEQQIRSVDRRIAELRALRGELRELRAAADAIPEVDGATCRIIEHVKAAAATA